jgi:hypothetical protein
MKIGMTGRGLRVVVAMVMVGCGGGGDGGRGAASVPTTQGQIASADGASSGAGNAVAAHDPASGAARPQGVQAPDGSSPSAARSPAPAAAKVESAPPREAKPFAKTPEEATALIDDAVSNRGSALIRCVESSQVRKKDPHAKVVVEIGIDQEGILIGVKSAKGAAEDAPLNECVRLALAGAPFPRSHAGVITIKKTFEDAKVYR